MKFFILFLILTTTANAVENQCRVIDQSGTIDVWHCRNSDNGRIRCYADVEFENGQQVRINGSCVDSYSACWSTGPSRVEACD